MAYQDDFRNKVISALKSRNLAVDISSEETQNAIVEEVQSLATTEQRPMSPEEMQLVLKDVANQLASENQAFTAQSYDFVAYQQQLAGGGAAGNYPSGGFAVSTSSKDILIIPTAGTAGTVNTLSQIDFKYIYNPLAFGVNDPNEVKSSIFNWAERMPGVTFDTPVLGIGGAWGGVSYTPNTGYGIGASIGSGVGGSIYTNLGRGNIIFLRPAQSTINAALFNDIGLDSTYASNFFTITGYNSAVPNASPTAGFAVSFGGIGNSGPIGISGAASGTQYNQIKFLSPLTIANNTVTDTLALGLSATGLATTQLFVAYATGQAPNNYVLSAAESSFTKGDLFYAAGTGHTNLSRLGIGANNTYLASNGSTPFWTNSIAANTVSVNAATGSTLLYPLLNNVAGSGSAVSTDAEFFVDPAANILRYSSGSIYAGTALSATIHTASGDLSIRPGANTTTAIQLDNLAGQPVLNVDTTNNRVSIGANVAAPNYTLDVAGYVNVATGSSYLINGVSVLSSTSLGTGITNSALTALGTVTTGTWSATAITVNYGGTGFASYAIGDLLYADTTTTLAKRAAVAAGSVLASQGTNTAPAYVATSTLSVGFATTASNNYVVANTVNADNYITFAPGVSSGTAGVGLSISNTASQLTYNPNFQQLKVPYISGTAFTATNLTGTILTASQPNITSASSLATVGTIGTGIWQGTAVGTTYGGTGSNLGSGIANSNKIIVTGTIAGGYAATLIDGANSGYLLAANGNGTAPSFVNSTAAAFTFSSGALSINNAIITSGTVANTPTNATDLVNKSYADSLSGGLDPHASVRLTTVSAIGGSYRQAGVAGTLDGFGDYIIATTPAALIGSDGGWDTVGIALTNGQRVLIKDGVLGGYASGSGAYSLMSSRTTYGGFANSYIANGIYTVASYGGAATSGWLLVRATDTDNQNAVAELTGGTFTFVEEGSTYADNGFVCTNDTTTLGQIGFGSTQIAWSAFSGGAAIINGQGISKTGNTIAANFNLAQSGTVNANLSNGFSIGGARSGSVGSSSYATFTVTSASATNNTLTGAADGFTLQSGVTQRTLTVTGSDITLTGGGFTLTLGSNSTASFNGQTLAMTASMGNITLAGSGSPTATTQTLVQSGLTQYQLSSQTNTWATGDMYYMGGTAFTALTRLAVGTGNSVLVTLGGVPTWGAVTLSSSSAVTGTLGISNGGTNSTATPTNGGVAYGNGTAYAFTAAGTGGSVLVSNGNNPPTWQVLSLTSSNTITGVLGISNGGTNNGSLSVTAGQVVYTDGSKLAATSAGTTGQPLLSNGSGAPAFGTLTLAGGGTSNTASGASVAWQLAAYNNSGNGISGIAQPTASNSVLIQSAANTAPVWSNGPLGILYGGSNATSFTTTNGVLVYDGTRLVTGAGLTFASGSGLSVIGSINSNTGYFVNGNSLVTSITPSGGSAIYGGVTIAVSNTNVAGSLTISGSSQTITINGPGTGITGTGAATQVAYYNAIRELTGSTLFTYSPTAATGVGLSVNVNSASGTLMYLNSSQAMTSGFLVDIDNNGSQRYTVDWKGMATHTVGSGNTGLVVSGGRTILSSATTNYASLSLTATGTDPSSPNVGDLWYNGTNLYFRKTGGTNFDLLVGSVSGSGTANKIAKWSSASALTDSNISDAGTGMTITSTSSIATAGSGATALLTLQTLSADNSAIDRYFVRGVTSAGARLFSIDTSGNLRATTKSFDIPHPTKEGMRLVYGVLEGPEHGVYHRGTVEGKGVIKVELPEYWHKLVGDQYTIQLTPWGNYNVSIDLKTENYFTIQLVGDFISRKFKNIKVDYIVHGSRLDAPLDTEQ